MAQRLGWNLIDGCWRFLDGVSKNRVHVLCDARNAPVATVQDLMGADLASALAAGLPGLYSPGGAYRPMVDASPGGLPGVGGFGAGGFLGESGGEQFFEPGTGAFFGGQQANPVAAVSFASFEGPAPAVDLSTFTLHAETTTGSTLVPLPPATPTRIPEASSGALLLAALIGLALLAQRRIKKDNAK